jgi:hypothetical protein
VTGQKNETLQLLWMQENFATLRVFLFTEKKERGWSKVHELLTAILRISQDVFPYGYLLHVQEIFACFAIQIRCKRPKERMLDMHGDANP